MYVESEEALYLTKLPLGVVTSSGKGVFLIVDSAAEIVLNETSNIIVNSNLNIGFLFILAPNYLLSRESTAIPPLHR